MCDQPSVVLNEGFSEVVHYVARYTKHIHTEFDIPEVEEDTADDIEVEHEDDITDL